MLIFTFFFALGTGVGLSQQKADANCNKEISFSSRFTASLAWFGLFWFSFLLKSIRFVESTGLYLWREVLYWHLLQRSCTEQQKVLLMNFCRLASPAKLTLNWYNCFSRQKLILTDALRRGLISHLLPCYPSWQSSGHICAHSCILEIPRVTAHFRPPLCLSVRLNAKNKWYFKARK